MEHLEVYALTVEKVKVDEDSAIKENNYSAVIHVFFPISPSLPVTTIKTLTLRH